MDALGHISVKSVITEYRYPLLFKSSLYATSLLQKTYISTCFFTSPKISEGDFCFYEKRPPAKTAFTVSFAGIHYRGSAHPEQQERPCQAPSQELHSPSQHQASTASTVSGSICALSWFILCILSKMCPIIIASSLNTFWFMKVFIGTLYFWIARETCTSSLLAFSINSSPAFLLLSLLPVLPEIFSDQREMVGKSYFIHSLIIFLIGFELFFFCLALIMSITTF